MKSLITVGLVFSLMAPSYRAQAEEKQSGDLAADIGAVGIPVIAGSIALYKEDYDGFWMFAKGATYTLAATQALKYTVKEERPNGEDNLSFPSGIHRLHSKVLHTYSSVMVGNMGFLLI